MRVLYGVAGYAPRDNGMLLACVDELLRRIDLGEPPARSLDTPAMGDVWAPAMAA